MKIPITQTILHGMPDVVAQNVVPFLRSESIEFTPVQRVAAYGFQYYLALYDDGFTGFFDLYLQDDARVFNEMFAALGIRERLDYLVFLAESGQPVEGEKALRLEEWFDEHMHEWWTAMQDYVRQNANEFFEIVDEDYTMLPHKMYVPIAGTMAAVFLAFMIIIALTQKLVNYPLFFLLTFIIVSPLLALVLYGLFWRISVKKDIITVRRPLRRTKSIPMEDIAIVKRKPKQLVVYAYGKRAFTIRFHVGYLSMFLTQLELAGKLEKASEETLTVHQQKVTLVTVFIWPAAAFFLFLESVRTPSGRPQNIYEILLFVPLLVIALLYSLLRPWRKIMVDDDNLILIKMLGNEQVCPLASITKVVVQNENMTIYAGRKKIVTVSSQCEGSGALFAMFRNEENSRVTMK
ncbi:hypothetical protein LJC07_07430 [Christensenellaceae bacterium OttesenSCG-928-L17]|nr:hypothetical protein [Christensenellaceae bacterium OttesenSCG-928-L17]